METQIQVQGADPARQTPENAGGCADRTSIQGGEVPTKARLTFGTWENCITVGIGDGEDGDVGHIRVDWDLRQMGRGSTIPALSP